MKPRYYQQEAINKGFEAIQESDVHPVIVLPCGTGKSLVFSKITERFLETNPGKRVVCLSHVDKILKQNRATLEKVIGNLVTTYSASVGEKNANGLVVIAGIQSAFRAPELFKDVGLILVDECHLVNTKNEGMYRKFLNNFDVPVIGLTASPFRLGHGYITDGEDVLFNKICYDASSYETYNKLVDEGYLAKIFTKKTLLELDLKGVRTTAGDFNSKDLAEAVNRTEITEAALKETMHFGDRYKHWLIFAIDINHCENIAKFLNENGIPTVAIHSKMETDAEEELQKYREGVYRAVVSVEILTTGFDFAPIDLLVMLRPTKSATLHVQTAGRCGRPAPGKDHALFLDFSGNTERLGPINAVQVKAVKKKKKPGSEPIVKECPSCYVLHHPTVKVCDACGHEFEFKEKIKSTAATKEILKKNKKCKIKKWVEVDSVHYSLHQKAGQTDSLRVQYRCGLNTFSEWIPYGRKTKGGHIAKHWVNWRWPNSKDFPRNVQELLKESASLRQPKRIFVNLSGNWAQINDAEF